MKKVIILLGVTCIISFTSESLFACTSFAVYGSQVIYGMNFDFLNLPMKFIASTQGDITSFHLAFERTLGDVKFFVNTAAMNTKGLFASCQELHPTNENPPGKSDENLFTFELYDAVNRCPSVKDVLELSRDKPLIDLAGLTLHNLFADTSGMAVVTEAGDKEKAAITEKEGTFIVMTNFPNQSLAAGDFPDEEEKGADRYILCHEYLNEHGDDFNIEHGLKLLEKAYNRDPEYPTGCSMVFDPQNLMVYAALFRDFEHIWQVSVADKTVKEYRGFDTARVYKLDEEGILLSDLTGVTA